MTWQITTLQDIGKFTDIITLTGALQQQQPEICLRHNIFIYCQVHCLIMTNNKQ